MLKGIKLMLMIGKAVPVPVGKDVIEALTELSVISSTTGPSVFTLKFELSTNSPLHTVFLLAGSSPIATTRVIIALIVNSKMDVLIDGVITKHDVEPGSNPSTSTLSITGEDLTRVMDYIEHKEKSYPGTRESDRVKQILMSYSGYGITPVVMPTFYSNVPNPIKKTPKHDGTDLAYIKALGEEVGYVLYHEPLDIPNKSIMYWGPELKLGMPQSALSANMDGHSNIEKINFSFDSEKATTPILIIKDTNQKATQVIQLPNINPLNPPLGAVAPISKRFESHKDSTKHTLPQAMMSAMAKSAKSNKAVTAKGSLDVARYGKLLKARKLVGVRGVGHAFNGLYYVEKVTSSIKRGEFKQSFELSRNGLMPTTPGVYV